MDADYVIPVPDSGVPSAIGYAEHSKILLNWVSLETTMLEELLLNLNNP